MPGLSNTMGAIPPGGTRRAYGTAYWDGSEWFANINGSMIKARWLDPIQPSQGGPIVVDITDDGRGQSSALVIGGYTDKPRPSTGTISVVGITELLVIGADAGGYTTDRFLGPIGGYSVGDPVYLTWDASQPTVMGIVAGLAAPNDAPLPEAPTAVGSGYEVLTATSSDTYWGPGGWGSYATSRFGGEDVYAGTWAGVAVTGSWFYGAARPVLAGKTITKILFRLPARISAAGASGAVSINLYVHTSGSRPGGDVTRTVGPYTVSVPAGYTPGMVLDSTAPPGYVLLPLTFAPALVAGGGISIAGGSYAGFNSRLDEPESGKLILDWEL